MRFIEKIHSMQYPNNKERLSVVYLYGTDFSETTWPNFSKLCTLPKNDIRRYQIFCLFSNIFLSVADSTETYGKFERTT